MEKTGGREVEEESGGGKTGEMGTEKEEEARGRQEDQRNQPGGCPSGALPIQSGH